MAEEQTFDTAAIATIWSGKVLVSDFSAVHEVFEKLMGGPVWTHQFPAVRETLMPYVADWCPEIAAFDYSAITPETVWDERARLIAAAGETCTLRCPLVDDHKPDPMRDIPRGMEVLTIKPDPTT